MYKIISINDAQGISPLRSYETVDEAKEELERLNEVLRATSTEASRIAKVAVTNKSSVDMKQRFNALMRARLDDCFYRLECHGRQRYDIRKTA